MPPTAVYNALAYLRSASPLRRGWQPEAVAAVARCTRTEAAIALAGLAALGIVERTPEGYR